MKPALSLQLATNTQSVIIWKCRKLEKKTDDDPIPTENGYPIFNVTLNILRLFFVCFNETN